MGVKITGLDKMQKQLKAVERATEALNGSYDVRFDANDPSSIENAIQEAYYSGNQNCLSDVLRHT